MRWRTHLAGGMASLWLLEPFLPPRNYYGPNDPIFGTNLGVLTLLAGLGELLPDIEQSAWLLAFRWVATGSIATLALRLTALPIFTLNVTSW